MLSPEVETKELDTADFNEIVEILKFVYGDGYMSNRMTFSERKSLRARTYKILKKLGVSGPEQATI